MGGCAGKQKNVMSKAVVKIRQPDTKPVSSIPNADGQKPDNKKKEGSDNKYAALSDSTNASPVQRRSLEVRNDGNVVVINAQPQMISSVSKKDIKIVDKEYEIDEADEHKFAKEVSKVNLRVDNDQSPKPNLNKQIDDGDMMTLSFPQSQLFTINSPNKVKPEIKDKLDEKPKVVNLKKTKKNLNEILNNPDDESDTSSVGGNSPKHGNKKGTPKHKKHDDDDDEFDVVVDVPKKKAKDPYGGDLYTNGSEHHRMNHYESNHEDISTNSQLHHRVQFISQDENHYEEGGVRFHNEDG